ncbi:MAG: ABC transporter permease [Firmicutes bacterium]|nr:ABC transporter permease [Alicyclobacillaceae bacterium]MCL6497211.1 ABC transporter permease [Bacillota bacterium]
MRSAGRWQRRLGAAGLGALGLLAVLAPVVARHPNAVHLGAVWSPPSARFWLGTDGAGRDLWARLVFGTRLSLGLGGAAALLATAFGGLWGLVAGYAGGWVDGLLTRVTEFWLAAPLLIWLVFLADWWGQLGWPAWVGLVALGLWPPVARAVRARAGSFRQQPFVEAERGLGASPARILFRHLLPPVAGLVLALFPNVLAEAIYVEAALSFLGLGPPPPAADWGTLLAEAVAGGMWVDPLALVWPGLAIVWAVAAATLLAEGLRRGLALSGEAE